METQSIIDLIRKTIRTKELFMGIPLTRIMNKKIIKGILYGLPENIKMNIETECMRLFNY
jgi:hypothetical protein